MEFSQQSTFDVLIFLYNYNAHLNQKADYIIQQEY